MLVFITRLVVLGPERFPIAIKMVSGWILSIRSVFSMVQNELTQELELQDSLQKMEGVGKITFRRS